MNEHARLQRSPVMPENERRALILQAAERIFSAMGYGEATMEEVARECGMAKKTLYRFFPDKLSLFTALVDSHDNPRFTWQRDESGETDLESALRSLLLEIGRFIMAPRQVLFTRLIISEAGKSPELSRRFYNDCMIKTQGFVARELEAVVPAGIDPMMMADMFVGAATSIMQLKSLIVAPDWDDADRELEQRVDATVALFLRVMKSA